MEVTSGAARSCAHAAQECKLSARIQEKLGQIALAKPKFRVSELVEVKTRDDGAPDTDTHRR